jgi:hypothetical protein
VLAFLRRRRAAEGFDFVYEETADQMQELMGFEGKFSGMATRITQNDHPQITQITQMELRR